MFINNIAVLTSLRFGKREGLNSFNLLGGLDLGVSVDRKREILPDHARRESGLDKAELSICTSLGSLEKPTYHPMFVYIVFSMSFCVTLV